MDEIANSRDHEFMPFVACWTGCEAALLRRAMRLTVEEFAATLGVHPRTVNKWEARQNTIQLLPHMQAVLDSAVEYKATAEVQERFHHLLARKEARTTEDGFLANPVQVAPAKASTRDALSPMVEFMGSDLAGRREFLELSLLTGTALIASVHQWPAAAAADTAVHTVSRGMSRDEIHALAQAVEVFGQWDASGHGGLHRKAVIGQLHAMHDALQGRYPPGDYQLLLETTAELAQLAGFMTWDAGLDAPAQRYYLYALDIAKRAENPGLGAKIIGDMSQLSLGQGKVDDSLALIHAGLAMLPHNGNQLVRSELHGHEACAYARFGKNELTATRRSVDAALEAFDRSTVDDQQRWNDYMDRAEVDGMATAALSRLAVSTDSRLVIPEAHQAEIYAREALAHRPPHRVRSRLFDEVRLSTVRLAQGEPEESAVIAHRVLDQATQMTSTGVLKRLAAHSANLAGHDRLAPVAEFRSRLSEHLPRMILNEKG